MMKEQPKPQIQYVAVPQSSPDQLCQSETERELRLELEKLRNEADQLRARNRHLEGCLACYTWDNEYLSQ